MDSAIGRSRRWRRYVDPPSDGNTDASDMVSGSGQNDCFALCGAVLSIDACHDVGVQKDMEGWYLDSSSKQAMQHDWIRSKPWRRPVPRHRGSLSSNVLTSNAPYTAVGDQVLSSWAPKKPFALGPTRQTCPWQGYASNDSRHNDQRSGRIFAWLTFAE